MEVTAACSLSAVSWGMGAKSEATGVCTRTYARRYVLNRKYLVARKVYLEVRNHSGILD